MVILQKQACYLTIIIAEKAKYKSRQVFDGMRKNDSESADLCQVVNL